MNRTQDQSQSSWRQLDDEWREVCDRWNDGTTRYFEAQYWVPVADETRAFHHSLDALFETLHAAHIVCSE
jgi:hypothetical protein